MSIKPTGSNVLVKRIAAAKETLSGIILKTTDEPDRAHIVAIGPEVTEVSVDEIAIINWNKATGVGDNFYIIPITEVILTIAG